MKFGTDCREVHRLSSEGMDRALTLGERARVRLHLLGCTACRNFNAQLRLLREAMHKLNPGAAADDEEQK